MIINNAFFVSLIEHVIKKHKKSNDLNIWGIIYDLIKNELFFDEYSDKLYSKIKGDIFEYVCYYYYLYMKHKTYLYRNIPDNIKNELSLPDTDKGIDLIYKDGNNWIGVQCKWRCKNNGSIGKECVTAFLHEIELSKIDGIFFTNMKRITPRFDNKNNLKWFIESDLINELSIDYLNFVVNYSSKDINKLDNNQRNITFYKNIELRPYQENAIDTLLNCDDKNMKCISACGTGKSIIMFEYIRRFGLDNKILILLPSLQLIRDIYDRIKNYFYDERLNILCVCSINDKTTLTNNEANESDSDKIYNEFISLDNRRIFTTDIDVINNAINDDKIIILSTYQSSKLVSCCDYDLCLFDEAHKTVNNDQFGYMLNNENCQIDKRIYFTATPRYYKGKNSQQCLSMDNEDIYGKNIFNYSFKQAIEDGYILNYKLILYMAPTNYDNLDYEKYLVDSRGILKDSNYIISAIQLCKHILNNKNSNKILTYHNTVAKATKFKKILDEMFDEYSINANIFVMSGKDKISSRKQKINEFSNSNIGIICSSKVLNEGVDIPCVNTIMFVDPRKSTVDVTQCIGRAMRINDEDKEDCNVIIPIHYNNLDKKHEFSECLKIMSAMVEIDDELVDYFIEKNVSNKKNNTSGNSERIMIINMNNTENFITVEDVKKELKIEVVKNLRMRFEYNKKLLFEYCDVNGDIPLSKTKYKETNIGSFFRDQKKYINDKNSEVYISLSENDIVKGHLDKFIEKYRL